MSAGLARARVAPNDEIAVRLKVSRKTIEVHLSRLYDRFGVMGRVELALRVDHEGWLEIESNGSTTSSSATGGPSLASRPRT